ncbi:hypothetical protein KKB71_02060 [Patescibacteria group bacterium]|nr:hypothetical protein [Patescibacteria group bacterium]
MNRRILILTIVIIILLIAGGAIWYFSRNGNATNGDGGIFSSFFPFGGDRDINGDTFPSGSPAPPGFVEGRNFIQLTPNAVSGAAPATPAMPEHSEGGQASTTIRYIEKATGHIFEINPDGQSRERISNTTILKSFESFWSADAGSLVIRYLEDSGDYFNVRNFSGSIATTTSLEGIFLANEIKAMAVSPIENNIFYIIPSKDTNIGITATFGNEKQKQVLETPFSEFIVNWPSSDIVSLLTKPSSSTEGFLYFLNIKTKSLDKILGDIKGLSALVSPDAKKILYSQNERGKTSTKILDIKEKSSSALGLDTLAEKCIWSKKDKSVVFCGVPVLSLTVNNLDDWYQGLASFNDAVWMINLSTSETNILLENSETDIINPFLTFDEDYLIFTNKKDSTLWSLKLK